MHGHVCTVAPKNLADPNLKTTLRASSHIGSFGTTEDRTPPKLSKALLIKLHNLL